MKLNRIATATAAAIVILSGCGVAHHSAVSLVPPATSSQYSASSKPVQVKAHAVRRPVSVDPSLAWLASPGGQAQVTFNDAVDTLAMDLEIEDHADTVANHLIFEADARVVRSQAEKILATPSLLPRVHRAAYKRMLQKFITVADLLQPGAGYGTTAQDYAAWYDAMRASNITVW
ncbi:MAG: hypothetical protein ABSB59_42245 [Streptosporangiaceae bacterium]|jgi:hypothetical protein